MADGWRNSIGEAYTDCQIKVAKPDRRARRDKTGQAAGDLADPSRLIQLRKSLDADADPVTLWGRQHQTARIGKCWEDPSESSKIVAWSERSDK